MIGYNEFTRGPLPAGSVAVLNGVTNAFNGEAAVSFTSVPAGVHTVRVDTAAGYRSLEDPAVAGQVYSIENELYGNPRLVEAIAVDTHEVAGLCRLLYATRASGARDPSRWVDR